MKKRLTRSLLMGAMAMAFCACGNDETDYPSAVTEETALLNITVHTPPSEAIVVSSRAGEAGQGIIMDEEDEAAVKTLNVYLFKKEAEDADYKYFEQYSFSSSASGSSGKLEEGATGEKTCSLPIDPALMDKNVKVVLIANDTPAFTLTKASTTLADFQKNALASAVVSDGAAADVLVGNSQPEAATGFPMTAVSEEARLTAAGKTLAMTLVRSVARIDIFNNAPGLIVTRVKLANVKDKSCLFPAEAKGTTGALNVPESAGSVSLQPLNSYTESLGTGGLPYDETGSSDMEKATKNTHRVFYLYEQAVTKDADSPVVTIEYEINTNPNDNGPSVVSSSRKVTGTVTVKFKKERDLFVDVTRNHLYKIRLGDGKPVDKGNVQVLFSVVDWKTGEEINETIEPGTDSKVPAVQ